MTSPEIRRHFLDFFQSKQHLIVASAPLVAKNDPTLMFNNSGMAQFKDFFLGNGTPPARRVADTQKCLRVSGKHNDLEDVGFDTYHHTMFEMLGNWSFGDYFKTEAIHWAWELLTEVYGLPKDRLYVSVFEGNAADGVPFDQEAFDLWKPIVGEDRIIYGNKKDNFWEMGDTGPCGPCSEIHVDLRTPEEVAQTPGKSLVNADHPQVVEIWNLVFMQFNRKADGSLEPLPARHVDTGMGFERLCMAIQGKTSNYDTDVFSGTIRVIEEVSGIGYGGTMSKPDVAMRVIADHIRAVSFAIADGLVPSNAKAGYVIRRILRRAIRYGYSYLNLTEPFMTKLVPTLAMQFADVFPELDAQRDFVATVIREEEISFLRTLGLGLKRLDQIIDQLTETEDDTIDGETVFELNDTFGFPADLTALVAREKGFNIDETGFQNALQQQKQRSRKDAASSAGDWIDVNDADGAGFVGYDQTEADAQIVKYRTVQNKQGKQYQIVISPTPFYAESGGQIGDTGTLLLMKQGAPICSLQVVDTKKENDLTVHVVDPTLATGFASKPLTEDSDKTWTVLPPRAVISAQADGSKVASWPDRSKQISTDELDNFLNLTDTVHATVDAHRRTLTSSNHSATHLLHAALREVLGNHVGQKGSYVGPDALRFDFAHFAKLTDDEIKRVETIVNERIRENIRLDEQRNVPIERAKGLGAMALFGEKYGDFVRVITFDPNFSVELCGGTHVPATGQIGLFKLTSEGSVSTGVRRIEAVTSEKALAMLNEQQAVLDQLKDLLKAPKDVVKALQTLLDERSTLQKQIDALQNEKLQQVKTALLEKVQAVNGHHLLVERVDVSSADALKQLAYELKAKVDNLALVLGADINGKPQLAVMLPDSLIQEKKLNAGQVVKELAKNIKGGGGGQPFFATAGGTDLAGLDAALAQGEALLR